MITVVAMACGSLRHQTPQVLHPILLQACHRILVNVSEVDLARRSRQTAKADTVLGFASLMY